MLNSLRLRLEVDNASVMRGMSQVDQKIIQTGHTVQEHLTDKLKGAFAIGAIEEMVRRTGEWNLELDRTAEKLQVSREHLQALRILAEHAGVAVEKIQTYYNKMEVASLNALKGNHKLSESFKALKTNATEVNRAFTSGDKEAQGNLLAKMVGARGNPGGQEAVMNIFGPKAVTDINSLGRQLGGGTVDDYAKQHESQILPEDSVKENAKAWELFLENAKSLAIKFNPVVVGILKIIEGLTNMINGTLKTIGAFANPMNWLSQKGRDILTLRGGAVGRSIVNTIPQLLSGIGNIGSKALGYGHRFDWHWMDDSRKAYGNALTEEQHKESEGMGDALTTVATFGAGPAAKVLGFGTKAAGAAATFAKAEGMGGKLGALGKTLGGAKDAGIADRIISAVMKNPKGEAMSAVMKDLGIDMAEVGELNAADGAALKTLIEERLASKLGKGAAISKLVSSLGYAGAGFAAGSRDVNNAIAHDDAMKALEAGGGKGGAGVNPALLHGMSGLNFAGGSGNLAVGGVFGVNIQAKLVTLNQRMVSLLEKLVSNTNPLRDTANSLVSGQDWVGN